MSKTFLIVAEHKDGIFRRLTYELIGAAKTIAGPDDRIAVALIGSNVRPLADGLASYGVGSVYVADDAELANYTPDGWFCALRSIVDACSPVAVIFGHTAMGRDLAPLVAASLDCGQISDVTSIIGNGDDIRFVRPLYAGKAFEEKRFTETPWVLTVRPNNLKPAEPGDQPGNAIQDAASGDPAIVNSASFTVVEMPFRASSLRTVIQQVVRNISGKIDLTEAKIVVSGGRGVRSAEGFKPLEELAEALGGAVGASRGACDAGYCDYALQIGQTGKVVTPELYIACGISGAIQHLAGMSQSRVIVAINKDPEAPIFKVADYGIVGDLFEIVPLLTAELRGMQNKGS